MILRFSSSTMCLKNPVTGALCKTRQENAEVYRHFAEKLYSRTQATTIDQGIDLLDQRPVNHLLAAEPDEPELWSMLKNRKCGSAPGGDGKVVGFYKAMCAPLEGGSGRGLTQLLEVAQHNNLEVRESGRKLASREAQASSKVGRSQQSE